MHRLFADERGSMIAMMALAMVVVLGMTALVVDAGIVYMEKSRLQKAVDAAALAGARELPGDPAQAREEAKYTAQANGVVLSDADITISDANREIRASKVHDKELVFAKILGFTNAEVAASGVVRLDALSSYLAASVIPLGINYTKYPDFLDHPDNLTLKWSHEESENGNWGYLDFKKVSEIFATYTYPTDPGNAKNIVDRLKVGEEYTVPIYRNLPKGFPFDPVTNECGVNKTEPNGKHCIQILGFAKVKIKEVITNPGHQRSAKASLVEVIGITSTHTGNTGEELFEYESHETFRLVH